MRGRLLIVAVALVLPPISVAAQQLPTLKAPVTDLAHVVDPASAATIDARIRALQKASGDAMAVAVVPTIAPYGSIDEYAVKLFERAGIGRRDKDNGLLVVVATREHAVRIEVGYGLEEFITDGFAGETIRTAMLPEFRANRYGAGLVAGTSRLIDRIAQARGVTLDVASGANPSVASGGSRTSQSPANTAEPEANMVLGGVLFFVICGAVLGAILLVIWWIAKRTGGARATPVVGGPLGSGWSAASSRDDDDSGGGSSDSGSSYDGFDGGESGGGGASESW